MFQTQSAWKVSSLWLWWRNGIVENANFCVSDAKKETDQCWTDDETRNINKLWWEIWKISKFYDWNLNFSSSVEQMLCSTGKMKKVFPPLFHSKISYSFCFVSQGHSSRFSDIRQLLQLQLSIQPSKPWQNFLQSSTQF